MGEIGGYFEWPLGDGWEPEVHRRYDDGRRAICFQSARAALAELIRVLKPVEVYVPRYLCRVVSSAAEAGGARVIYYSVGTVTDWPDLPSGAMIVAPVYFGVIHMFADEALRKYGPKQVILDCAQVWHDEDRYGDCSTGWHHAIYSPRKFEPFPDGGVLVTTAPVCAPTRADPHSAERLLPMFLRAQGRFTEGRNLYRVVEDDFGVGIEPLSMSRLTRAMMAADSTRVDDRRRDNYRVLSAALPWHGGPHWELPAGSVPLCFPFALRAPQAATLRWTLAETYNIHCPHFWPDAMTGMESEWELNMRRQTLFLPVDQRYGACDMEQVADAVRKVIA